MATIMNEFWWNIVFSFIGGLFGSGTLWAFLSYRQREKEIELSIAASASELQKDITNKLLDLIQKSEEYADVRDRKVSVPIPQNKLIQLSNYIDILKTDIIACEAKLAQLESREPRSINLKYIRPESPKNVTYQRYDDNN